MGKNVIMNYKKEMKALNAEIYSRKKYILSEIKFSIAYTIQSLLGSVIFIF